MFKYLLVSYFVLTALVCNVQPIENTEVVTIVISITTFIFAIILGFSMAERHSRFSSLKQIFSSIDGLILNSYYASGALGKKVQEQYKKLLDQFLMRQFDYKVDDFDHLSDDIRGMQEFFWKLPNKNARQNLIIDHALMSLEKVSEYERNVKYNILNRMAVYEWASLIILALISLYCLVALNDGSWIMVIFIPILGTSIILLLLVLLMLDKLSWKHGQWMVLPVLDIFKKLNLTPYIVDDMLVSGNITRKSLKGMKVRVASFPKSYPNLTGKKVKIVKF